MPTGYRNIWRDFQCDLLRDDLRPAAYSFLRTLTPAIIPAAVSMSMIGRRLFIGMIVQDVTEIPIRLLRRNLLQSPAQDIQFK
jgi:hypothetical protein